MTDFPLDEVTGDRINDTRTNAEIIASRWRQAAMAVQRARHPDDPVLYSPLVTTVPDFAMSIDTAAMTAGLERGRRALMGFATCERPPAKPGTKRYRRALRRQGKATSR